MGTSEREYLKHGEEGPIHPAEKATRAAYKRANSVAAQERRKSKAKAIAAYYRTKFGKRTRIRKTWGGYIGST